MKKYTLFSAHAAGGCRNRNRANRARACRFAV